MEGEGKPAMASELSTAQVVGAPVATFPSWQYIRNRAIAISTRLKSAKVYGVPRGGCVVAALVGTPVDRPDLADAIVDDVIDSGATRDRYTEAYPSIPFYALFDKTEETEPMRGKWIVFPWEKDETPVEDNVKRLLEYLGEDVKREGLKGTPARVVRALGEMMSGRSVDVRTLLEQARFTVGCDEIVMVRRIPFASLCEHHLMPFHGHVTVGYLPQGYVVGLSKIPRLVAAITRRLQIQERMTREIASAFHETLNAHGTGVIVEGYHTCMSLRGARCPADMVTSSLLGRFRESGLRSEFLSLSGAQHY
jgi:GTP cyclohydrolase I